MMNCLHLRQNFEQCILVLLGPLLKGLCVGVDLSSELNIILGKAGYKVPKHGGHIFSTGEWKLGKHLHGNLVVLYRLSRHTTYDGGILIQGDLVSCYLDSLPEVYTCLDC